MGPFGGQSREAVAAVELGGVLAAAAWCLENGRAVIERPIAMDELGGGALIYANVLIGLVPAFPAGRPAVPLPRWFDAPAIERRLAE